MRIASRGDYTKAAQSGLASNNLVIAARPRRLRRARQVVWVEVLVLEARIVLAKFLEIGRMIENHSLGKRGKCRALCFSPKKEFESSIDENHSLL